MKSLILCCLLLLGFGCGEKEEPDFFNPTVPAIFVAFPGYIGVRALDPSTRISKVLVTNTDSEILKVRIENGVVSVEEHAWTGHVQACNTPKSRVVWDGEENSKIEEANNAGLWTCVVANPAN